MKRMGRRNISAMRLGRCVAFLIAAAFLLPFTILLMVADQEYNLTYNTKRVFYQEVSILCKTMDYFWRVFIKNNIDKRNVDKNEPFSQTKKNS